MSLPVTTKQPKSTSIHLVPEESQSQLLFQEEQWCPEKNDHLPVLRHPTPVLLRFFEPSLLPAWCPPCRRPQQLLKHGAIAKAVYTAVHSQVLGHMLGKFSESKKHFKERILEFHLFFPFWDKEQET